MLLRIGILLAVAAATAAFAWWWQARQGQFTEAHGRFSRADLGLSRADKPSAVLIEFFGEHCAPCVTVQQRITKLASEVPGVQVVSVDAGARLDLSDRYAVKRVPTLFVADGDLQIVWRASGVPSEDAIRAALLGPDWAGRPHPAAETASPSAH